MIYLVDLLNTEFVVRRIYESVSDPEVVCLDKEAAWHIKVGAFGMLSLMPEADNCRQQVAIVNLLLIGLEILGSTLAVSGSISWDSTNANYRYG